MTSPHKDDPTRRDDIRAMAREIAANIPDAAIRALRTTAELHAFCADLEKQIRIRSDVRENWTE